MTKLLVLALVLFASACCCAQTSTPTTNDGNRLLSDCSSVIKLADDNFKKGPESSSYPSGWCFGFVNGFLEGFDASTLAASKTYAEYLESRTSYICIPEEATIGQDIRVIIKWLNEHPERLHEDAGALIFIALKTAFPCAPKHAGMKTQVPNH